MLHSVASELGLNCWYMSSKRVSGLKMIEFSGVLINGINVS